MRWPNIGSAVEILDDLVVKMLVIVSQRWVKKRRKKALSVEINFVKIFLSQAQPDLFPPRAGKTRIHSQQSAMAQEPIIECRSISQWRRFNGKCWLKWTFWLFRREGLNNCGYNLTILRNIVFQVVLIQSKPDELFWQFGNIVVEIGSERFKLWLFHSKKISLVIVIVDWNELALNNPVA